MVATLIALAAHMHTVIPEEAFLRKGKAVSIQYYYGHPFEHEVIATKRPERLFAVSPEGATEDLLPALAEAKEGFRLTFTPADRGDYYIVLQAPPLLEEDACYRERAKLILHVQSQRGWERPLADGLDIVPLVRPYGLEAGSVFRGRVVWNGKPVAGCAVEAERYNPSPPKELPDDAFITGVALSDEAGIFVANLPEPGWWCVSATKEEGRERHGAKELPVKHSITFWFPVGRK